MIQTSGVRVSPLRVAGNGASDPVTALGASPSRRPLAIPAPHLLSAPWECVTNIRRVPHLELATARAPFLRASVQVSLRLASPCPLPPAGNASLRNRRTLTRWLVGCWLRVCRPLFGGWFSGASWAGLSGSKMPGSSEPEQSWGGRGGQQGWGGAGGRKLPAAPGRGAQTPHSVHQSSAVHMHPETQACSCWPGQTPHRTSAASVSEERRGGSEAPRPVTAHP